MDPLSITLDVIDNATKPLQMVSNVLANIATASLKAAAALGALTAAFVAKGVIDATIAYGAFEARLLTIEGTYKRVGQSMAFLKNFEKATPFDLAQVTEAYIRLKNYGIDPTLDRMTALGNLAASNPTKTLEDAIEAVADAAQGEMERLKEFGIRKDMIANMGKNLTNAQGQILDYSKWQIAIFDYLAQRNIGAMERMQNTIPGKLSNIQSTLFQGFVQVGKAIEKPLMNALTVIDRVLQHVFSGDRLTAITNWLKQAFSVEHMKSFTKGLFSFGLRILDFFDNLMIKLQDVRQTIASVGAYIQGHIERIQKINEPLFRGDFKGALAAANKPFPKYGDIDNKPFDAVRQGIRNQMASRASWEASGYKFIDGLFKGLNDLPVRHKEGAGLPAALSNSVSPKMDALNAFTLGGGPLARLGEGLNVLGPGAKPTRREIPINVIGAVGHFKAAMREVAKEVLSEAIRAKHISVNPSW